eukprot:3813526-Pleurochrysis_carterae.AAC.1
MLPYISAFSVRAPAQHASNAAGSFMQDPLPQNIAAQDSHHEGAGKSCEHSNRNQPPEAGCCTETNPIVGKASPC